MANINILGKSANYLRLAAAKLRRGTVRFYSGGLPALYQEMHDRKISYVVLRWSHLVPIGPEQERDYREDIDHLIGDNQIKDILAISTRHPGTIKCDYYSKSGQSGSSYVGVPYYMPALAEQLLTDRALDPKGFYRPNPKSEFFGFAYHLCYHKGLRCGLAAGLDVDTAPAAPHKDYAEELRKRARAADIFDLPEPLTLLSLHEFLQSTGWNMPSDLMVRWPDQHPFLTALQAYERDKIANHVALAQDLTVFILREDGDAPDLQTLAKSMIAERFEILETLPLGKAAQDRLVRQTRGGDWIEKYCNAIVHPTVAVICRNAATPGPLPISMSPGKLQKRYPHISNTDVLIKRNIRAAINKADPAPFDRVALHATDNAFECVETLAAIFADDLEAALRKYHQADSANETTALNN